MGTAEVRCGACLADPPPWARLRTPFIYEGVVRQLLHQFKYSGDLASLAALSALCRTHPMLAELAGWDLVVPVPLHPLRLRRRGFNQAALLARDLFPAGPIDYTLLVRRRHTQPQTSLGGGDRRRNLAGAFEATDPAALENAVVLLVDDVCTTGATLRECAVTLRRAGARSVLALAVARAL